MLCTTPTVEHVSVLHLTHLKEKLLYKHKCIYICLKSKDKSFFSNWMLCLCLQVGDEESREQLIKTHYMARVGELTTQLQISDSKAVHFHSEVKPFPKTFISVTASFSKQLTSPQHAASQHGMSSGKSYGNFWCRTVTWPVPSCLPSYNRSTTIFVCFFNLLENRECRNWTTS